tara:strand:- start:1354 stop:1572 length:219 start_codon:yes stop_codon:yes gene_type:complete
MNRAELQAQFIHTLIGQMTLDDILSYAYDSLEEYYDMLPEIQLITDIKDQAPDLIPDPTDIPNDRTRKASAS